MVVLLLFLLIFGSFSVGQEPPASPKARFLFSAVDERGATIEDITAAEVHVTVGKSPVVLTSVTRYYQAPIRVMVVLDDSGSMEGHWNTAVAILVELLKSLPKDSAVGLITGDEKSAELLSSPDSILKYLRHRTHPKEGPQGRTRLWDHVHNAFIALGPKHRASDVIFVISDGGDNMSNISYPNLLREIEGAGTRVSGALLAGAYGETEEERTGAIEFLDLIRQTGGWNLTTTPFVNGTKVFLSGTTVVQNGGSTVIADFFHTIGGFYVAEFTPPAAPIAKPLNLKLTISDSNGIKRKHLVTTAPAQIYPVTSADVQP